MAVIYADTSDVAEAQDQWRTVTNELAAAGTLADANGHTLRRLIEFRVQYEKAAKHVAKHGAILHQRQRWGAEQTTVVAFIRQKWTLIPFAKIR